MYYTEKKCRNVKSGTISWKIIIFNIIPKFKYQNIFQNRILPEYWNCFIVQPDALVYTDMSTARVYANEYWYTCVYYFRGFEQLFLATIVYFRKIVFMDIALAFEFRYYIWLSRKLCFRILKFCWALHIHLTIVSWTKKQQFYLNELWSKRIRYLVEEFIF